MPPQLPGTQLPSIGAPPPVIAETSPPLPPKATDKSSSLQQGLAILLSLFLALFLAEAVVSLADDSLILLFDLHILTAIRGILFAFVILVAIAIYVLMGFTPMIPKRWFLPLTLFIPVAGLLVIPLFIYFYGEKQQIAWVVSLVQVLFGLGILYWVQGGFKFRWPLVTVKQVATRGFSWGNLSVFLLANVFLLLPVAVVYLAFCARLAVDHFSEGFVGLRPGGLTMQMRKYVRDDGKTIQLFPMAHIGDAEFYQKLSQSFPSNSIVLMEGVTDKKNLLTNKVSYKRMATSLGLADQQKEFKPSQGETVMADMDLDQFAPETIAILNMVMLIHADGLTPENVMKLMQHAPPPGVEKQLFDDILSKRNRHLLGEIDLWLLESDTIIVPWGAAHMPEIAREIEKSGFRLKETEDFVVIRFGSAGEKRK